MPNSGWNIAVKALFVHGGQPMLLLSPFSLESAINGLINRNHDQILYDLTITSNIRQLIMYKSCCPCHI